MHNRYLETALWVGLAFCVLRAAAVHAQTPPPATPAPPAQPSTAPAAQPSSQPAEPPQAGGTAPPAVPAEPPATLPVPPPPVTPAPAEEPPPPPPPQYGRLGGMPEQPIQEGEWNPWDHPEVGTRHVHEGFFLRLHIGPGGSWISRPDESYSGISLGMGLAIGGSVVEGLALHVDLQSTWLLSPDAEVNGRDVDFDANIGMQSLGLGVTYYFMPVDLFLSGSLGIGRLAFETDSGQTKETSVGFTLNTLVGKEWWVGSDWGIGVAGQFLFMRVEDYTDDESMNAFAFNLLFTATYN
jgi:hypothetical protein